MPSPDTPILPSPTNHELGLQAGAAGALVRGGHEDSGALRGSSAPTARKYGGAPLGRRGVR